MNRRIKKRMLERITRIRLIKKGKKQPKTLFIYLFFFYLLFTLLFIYLGNMLVYLFYSINRFFYSLTNICWQYKYLNHYYYFLTWARAYPPPVRNRTVITLFTEPHSWNDARAICQSRDSRLLDIEYFSLFSAMLVLASKPPWKDIPIRSVYTCLW